MAAPFHPAYVGEDLPQYYCDFDDAEIADGFRDFDNEKYFDVFDRKTRNPRTTNFCLDFGEDEAFCAFDLSSHSYSRLLESPRPTHLHTRWINLWQPYNQKDTLRTLGQHYDFSPRLLGMMCSDPIPPRSEASSLEKSISTLRSRASHRSKHSKSSSQKSKSGSNKNTIDSEESVGMTELMHSAQLEMVRDLTHYQIVEDIWHWSTVDWGRRYLCLGYNTLHNVRNKQTQSHRLDRDQDVPHGKRVWNWLLLCEDKTVISISEDPFPFANGEVHGWDLRMLYTVRRNLVNVFRQLTKAPTPLSDAALTQLPIRHRIGHSEVETAHRSSDTPGLLFYYLFEDWGTTFSLISRSEEGYAAELDRLRKEMLVKADLNHVDQLHHIGCQLAVLRRVYHSYSLLIERILERREATMASLKNSRVLSTAESMFASVHGTDSPNAALPADLFNTLGVSLSSAARVRFERLKDRITLYALSEIQECIDQKDSLVMMNFNLIAIKESLSVERLTWVTLVLAQITILFTPVTLMTGYFSIQFKNLEFEVGSYWSTFGIVLGLSFLMLVLFSYFSGTLNGHIIKTSWSQLVIDVSKRWWTHRKERRKMY
ncbi:hypothetical protein B5807_06240 [Epicoccum nigrum]|uniref:Uncharacterized protein n=1 Tax=Epicoccum nigrum TaxID=105696 RepID=A0A1Y2M0N8_EPING|nr:hypothetical protein B5807_06240 [Epicoccum nigrum]